VSEGKIRLCADSMAKILFVCHTNDQPLNFRYLQDSDDREPTSNIENTNNNFEAFHLHGPYSGR